MEVAGAAMRRVRLRSRLKRLIQAKALHIGTISNRTGALAERDECRVESIRQMIVKMRKHLQNPGYWLPKEIRIVGEVGVSHRFAKPTPRKG